MPNIEIHGLALEKATEVRKNLFTLFEEEYYINELVVTIYPTTVVDKDNLSQPFIRLISSFDDDTEEILEKLQIFRTDIECLMLKKFIPRKV